MLVRSLIAICEEQSKACTAEGRSCKHKHKDGEAKGGSNGEHPRGAQQAPLRLGCSSETLNLWY